MTMIRKTFVLALFAVLLASSLPFAAANAARPTPLAPIKTENPKDTMRTFMEAMKTYQKGLKSGNRQDQSAILTAVRTLNLAGVGQLVQEDTGKEAAIYLKEAIDRAIVINYGKIPPTKAEAKNADFKLPPSWRLKDTEITIAKVAEGPRAGEYLFSPDTVKRAKEFYEKIKHLSYLPGTTKGAGYSEPWLEQMAPAFLRGRFLGAANWQWLGIGAFFLIALAIRRLTIWLLALVKKLTARTETSWDDVLLSHLENPIVLLISSGALYFGLRLLKLDGWLYNFGSIAVQIGISFAIFWALYNVVDSLDGKLAFLSENDRLPIDSQILPMLRRSLKVAIVVLGTLITIQNLGINVMSLVAGFGLGGLAFALAAKETAANLFGSLMILSDKPFRVGDDITFRGVEGTVEEIGLRSTKMRTYYNSQVSIPNGMMATDTVDNLGRRMYRRTKTMIGVTYDTSPEQLEAFLEGIKNIILANEYSRKEGFHVVFTGFGDSSLDIMLYFFLKVPNFALELVQRQRIYMEILRLAQELDVDFAFPTTTLHVDSMPDQGVEQGAELATKPAKAKPAPEKLVTEAAEFRRGGAKAKPDGLGIYVPPYLDQG